MNPELLEIRNYSDVCKKLGTRELRILDFSRFPVHQQKKLLLVHKISNIAKLFNENFEFNWDDTSQYKWYPYFYKDSSTGLGWVFDLSYCHDGSSDGQVAFYKDRETSDFVGKLFLELYIELLKS